MKKVFLGMFLVFGLGFFSQTVVNGDELNIAEIVQSGTVSEEQDEQIKEFIKNNQGEPVTDESNDVNQSGRIQSRALVLDPLTNWRIGTKIVRDSGYVNTAMYMKHAEVINGKAPSTHYSVNNAWAKDVVIGNELLGNAYVKVRDWVRSGQGGSVTTSGSYAFTSGDKYYALHAVNYSYVFTRQSDGGVKIDGTVTDVYDFAWSNYNSIATGFANNYAKYAQEVGLIKPYNIVIKYRT